MMARTGEGGRILRGSRTLSMGYVLLTGMLYTASVAVTVAAEGNMTTGNMTTGAPPNMGSPTGKSSGNNGDDLIFGICAAIVILLLLVTIIVLCIHLMSKMKKQHHDIAGNEESKAEELELTKAQTLPEGSEGHVTSNGGTSHSPRRREDRVASYSRYDDTLTDAKPTGIPLADYPKYVHDNRQSLKLIEEFEGLPSVNQEKQTYAKEDQNKPKNRYKNILPYNNSRVVLEVEGDDPFSDYINASYIDSFTREKAYIASQGPKKNTINDHWRMIWQEKIRVISMVTKLEEGLKSKCECYWPELGTDEFHGGIHIVAEGIEENDFGVIRKFSIKKNGDRRNVIHFQFTKWPDKSVPKQTSLFLRYLRAVKAAYREDNSGPLLVHCSAGIGRSGVAIALDSVVEEARRTGKVNVHGFVQAMRDCRQNMVQTDEQYIFLHEAILEALICKDTRISVDEFPERLQQLKEKKEGSAETPLSEEFKTLAKMCPDPSPQAIRTGSKHECRVKNRDSTVLPIERNRAMLQTIYSDRPGGDYINASFVKGSSASSYFIVTQMPLPDTVIDFWTLVFDYKPTKIIMMNELDKTDPTFAQYWPDGGSTQFGPFTISTTSSEKHVGMITRTLQVQLTDSQNVRVVHQYQFLGWPGDNPKLNDQSKSLILDLLETVFPAPSTTEEQNTSKKVLVHCMNGASRSGVFCALKMALDQIQEENAVDLFQIVKALRADRMRMVSTENEYLFCYETIEEYLKSKDDEDERTEDEAEDDIETQTDATTNTEEHIYENEGFVQDE